MLIRKNSLIFAKGGKKKQKDRTRRLTGPSVGRQGAQSLLEYMTLLGIVTAVLVAMATYVGRGIQGMVKIAADQVGNQKAADQRPRFIPGQREDRGYLKNSASMIQSKIDKTTRQDLDIFNYIFDDVTRTDTETLTNLGFRKRKDE